MDKKARKFFTIYRALHPRPDGGRGILSIEECSIIETHSLVNYIDDSNEKVLNAVLFEGIFDGNYIGMDKSRLREESFSGAQKGDDRSWLRLKKGKLKKETEGLITAAH